MTESECKMLCEFYRLRANGIVDLVKTGKYEDDIAMEEVLRILESLPELSQAPEEMQRAALVAAQCALHGLTELGANRAGGGTNQ